MVSESIAHSAENATRFNLIQFRPCLVSFLVAVLLKPFFNALSSLRCAQ